MISRFLILILIIPFFGVAQQQHMNWYFGNNAGLDFSSGSPVALTNGNLVTTESCATISDDFGNLLFYTNGVDVWDATHSVMSNGSGLQGNTSSQCIIIPKPGSTSIYYILSTHAPSSSSTIGLRYSEVDMTLNGGLGDVTANKNISLNISNGEWITAVAHENCTDIWVLTHGHSTQSNFLAFLVDANGISSTPVTTNLSLNINSSSERIGVMRPKGIGDTVLMTLPHHSKAIEMITFDRATGSATAISNLYTSPANDRPYGLEFSRSGNVMYAADFSGGMYQYDFTAANISASRTFIGAISVSGELGQIQIGPDDKIYFGTNVYAGAASSVGVINFPETLGTGCGMVINGVSLGSATMVYGLPWYYNPFVAQQNNFVGLGNDTTLCAGQSILLDPGNGTPGISYMWSDGSTDSTFIVNSSGEVWVEMQKGTCPPYTDTIIAVYDTSQIQQQIVDMEGCSPVFASFTGIVLQGNVTEWIWDFGNGTLDTGQTVSNSFQTPGTYTITLTGTTSNNCSVNTTQNSQVVVYPQPNAAFDFNPDLDINPGDVVVFNDMSSDTIVTWDWQISTGDIFDTSSFEYVFPFEGDYAVQLIVTNNYGCADSILKYVIINGEESVYIPNAFTPNDDGLNDYFFAVRSSDRVSFTLQVFDRWGELLWEGTENQFWDGRFNGHDVKSDVYVWKLLIYDQSSNTDEVKQGHVTLIR